MKKIIMALALIASMVVVASQDVYQFKSTMYTYSLKSQKYVSTALNGELVIDTDAGSAVLDVYKKDTKEQFTLDLNDAEKPAMLIVSTNSTVTIESGITNIVNVVTTNKIEGTDSTVFGIVTGKKNNACAIYMSTFEDGQLMLQLAGQGAAKTVVTGCGPCGGSTSCTKMKTLRGSYIGAYDCLCPNGQHYVYSGDCELPEDKETTISPVYGTWTATLKYVDGAKYK